MEYEDSYKINFSNRSDKSGEDDLFVQRWSPRSFKKIEIPDSAYKSIFGAARWSQSCFNEQPWLFVTSSEESDRKLFLDLLLPRNREWAKNASLIGYIFAKRNFSRNNKPNRWGTFDTGAAWMAMTLQARMLGLYTHGMAGIKKDEVYEVLNIQKESYEILCAFVIGVLDKPEILDKERKEMEIPSKRKPLEEIWQKGIL